MGVGVGDYDGDGAAGSFQNSLPDEVAALYRSPGKGRFQDVAMAAGLGALNRYVEWGAGIADLTTTDCRT